jgi:hypothetical protein
MMAMRSRLAEALLAHAERTMPTARKDWAQAMRAEAEHIPEGARLMFAIGCVRGSYRQIFMEGDTMLQAGRWTIILGLCGFAAICLRTATVVQPHDASAMVMVLGLICLVTAAAFARWGFDRLPMLAAAGFSAALVAVLVIGDASALFSSEAASGAFYRAILLEQAVGWAALFGVAHLLLALEAKRGVSD